MDLTDTLLVKAAEKLLAKFLKSFENSKSNFNVESVNLVSRLKLHVERNDLWASQITVERLIPSKNISDVYVDLGLEPASNFPANTNSDRASKISELDVSMTNVALLGQPGAGKTTALKRVYQNVSRNYVEKESIPILIRVRKMSGGSSLTSFILAAVGITVSTSIDDPEQVKEFNREVVASFLDTFSAKVFIDGLDETSLISSQNIFDDLEYYLSTCQRASFLITCRTAAYRSHLPKITPYKLRPLSQSDVKKIAKKWLGDEATKNILSLLKESPYHGTEIRPLTLVQLCHVYLRKGGTLPKYPRNIYRTLIRLFSEDWDVYRQVKRDSVFEDFDSDRKQEFLEALSFELARKGARGFFSHSQLRDSYLLICDQFSLSKNQATNVTREIESHTGLIIEVEDDGFEFYHLSIQEYLCGEFLIKAGGYPWESKHLFDLPNEYAVSVGLASDPSGYLLQIVIGTFGASSGFVSRTENAIGQFIARLAAEKPNWIMDIRLGIAIAVLDDYMVQKNESCEWELLLDDKKVLVSLLSFIKICKVDPNSRNKIYPNYEYIMNAQPEYHRFLQQLGRKQVYYLSDTLLKNLKG